MNTEPQPTATEIAIMSIELAENLITQSKDAIDSKYSQYKVKTKPSNLYKLKHNDCTLTCFYNIFEICDICILTFDDQFNYYLLEKFCDNKYISKLKSRWIKENYHIQYLNTANEGHHYMVSWQYDEILQKS